MRAAWLALCATACAGATVPVASTPADDGCGPSATRLGSSCWSAEGTHWSVRAEAPSGEREFEIELLAAGRVRADDSGTASAATDEWFQAKNLLRVFLSDRFVEYRAVVTNGTVLSGEAINVRGQRWAWTARRIFGESSCAPDQARIEEMCMTVAGTRWELRQGRERALVEFLGDGHIAGGPSATDDRWSQEGGRLRFSLGPRELVAELTNSAEISGTYSGPDGGGRFTATRVESIAPSR